MWSCQMTFLGKNCLLCCKGVFSTYFFHLWNAANDNFFEKILFLKYILFWQNKLVISYQTNVVSVLFTSVPWTGAKGTEDDIRLRLLGFGPCVWAPAHPAWGGILRWCVKRPAPHRFQAGVLTPFDLHFQGAGALWKFRAPPGNIARVPCDPCCDSEVWNLRGSWLGCREPTPKHGSL